MHLLIRKKTIYYILLLVVYLMPTRISESFLPYSAYVFYIAQFVIGALLIREYGLFTKNRFTILFFLFMITGLPGMFFTYSASVISYIRYACWFTSMLGLHQFYIYASDEEVQHFLKTGKSLLIVTCVLTELFAMGGEAVLASGFFWGSKAITTQAIIMFVTFAIYYDIKYIGNITLYTMVGYIWSLYFCMFRHSGQGTTMLLLLLALLLLELVLKKNTMRIINPLVVLVSLTVAYYLVITLRFQDFDFAVKYVTEFLSKDVSLTGRDQIFSGCLKLLNEHIFFGYGFNNTIVNDVLGQRVMMFNTAHNSMLQMLLDFGVIGTTFFIALIYNVLSILKKSGKAENVVLYFSVIVMFIGGLVNMIIGTNYFWMIASLAIACHFRDNQPIGWE